MLSTLRAEWERVYADEDNRELAGALAWHDKFFPGVLDGLTRSVICDEAECRVARGTLRWLRPGRSHGSPRADWDHQPGRRLLRLWRRLARRPGPRDLAAPAQAEMRREQKAEDAK